MLRGEASIIRSSFGEQDDIEHVSHRHNQHSNGLSILFPNEGVRYLPPSKINSPNSPEGCQWNGLNVQLDSRFFEMIKNDRVSYKLLKL